MSAALTRREWLRLSAGTLLSFGLWPGRLRGEDAHEDFTFIAVNDLHALEDACRPWFDEVVRQMKTSAPTAEFCLLGGDLADNGTPAQLTLIKNSFSALDIPCHAVVGNHDYQSDTDRSAYCSWANQLLLYSSWLANHRLGFQRRDKGDRDSNISHDFELARS